MEVDKDGNVTGGATAPAGEATRKRKRKPKKKKAPNKSIYFQGTPQIIFYFLDFLLW